MMEEEFARRVSALRLQKDVSAREMSLSLGQNPGYIHDIETGKALPSMAGFFYICDYLGISPKDFFDSENKSPRELEQLLQSLKCLSPRQLTYITELVRDLIGGK